MTIWNDRLLPYPLLAPWTDDYGEAVFLASVPHAVINNGVSINVTIKYHLTSPTLQELVANRASALRRGDSLRKDFSPQYLCHQSRR